MTEAKALVRPKIDRREFLKVAAAGSAFMISGTALIKPSEAWAMDLKALKPETMRTLIQLARDIYPHDRFPDQLYAVAVKGHDDNAAADAAAKAMIEAGVAALDDMAKAAHGVDYFSVGWEDQRVALLKQIEGGAFFKTVRSGLVVSLYNQPEVWPYFGYEGESASKGGYIERGFNDLAWL
ncbi:MAG: twin-arginine translocation signal domain-containing protein [Hyphomicrobiales bacterium]